MGFVPELDAQKKEATRQKILATGLRVFAEKTIDAVNLTEIAKAAGVGMATVYRHFDKKPDLVLAVSAWVWDQYISQVSELPESGHETGADRYGFFLDAFVDLYRNHRDILRYNQFFNVYVQREGITMEQMSPFANVVKGLAQRFHEIWLQGKEDGTLRADVSENEMFYSSLHLMLAAATRYAVGLVYSGGVTPERELLQLRNMLLREYTVPLKPDLPARSVPGS